MPPAVSVIMPVYNGARYLRAALDSVLAQTLPAAEIVVVDDGSTDDTPRILADLGDAVRVVRRENGGPGAARNTGMALATSPAIAFFDADDLWPTTALATLAGGLEADPATMAVRGRTVMIDEAGSALPGPEPFHSLLMSAALFRRELLERVGPFSVDLGISDDTDHHVRVLESGLPLVRIDDVVHFYRRHAGGVSVGKDIHALRVLEVLKRSMDRRRASDGSVERIRRMDLERP
jgi:glycosyltransferase involved in cell wall biosynthesis